MDAFILSVLAKDLGVTGRGHQPKINFAAREEFVLTHPVRFVAIHSHAHADSGVEPAGLDDFGFGA